MSARRKKKQAPKGVRRAWWEYPTFFVFATDHWANGAKKARVELVLPDATKVDLGYFSVAANSNELRLLVGLRFKEIWDPERCCRRTPAA
jgi:hypothetical protein